MYTVAICDDEEYTCMEIEKFILEYAKNANIKVHIDIFGTGEEFKEKILDKAYYDIAFLDIELLTVSGIDIANYIRNDLENEALQIIYISSKQQYAMDLFKTRPMDFLVKPLSKEAVSNDFEQAVKLIERENQSFEFNIGHNSYKRYYKEIMYFQSYSRKIVLVTDSGMIEFYGKLDQVMSKLAGTDFIRIHKSYLVNCYFIVEYSYDWVKMKDGAVFTISKVNRTRIRDMLLNKRRNKYNELGICD